MDERRDTRRILPGGLRQFLEVLMMEERKKITFGDILDLLGRDNDIEVNLNQGEDNLTGVAGSSLWQQLEDLAVSDIGVDCGALDVWLEDEDES